MADNGDDVFSFHKMEYEKLRDLSREYISQINNLQIYFLGGCGAIYGLGIQQKLSWPYVLLLFLPFLFAIFGYVTYESIRIELFEIRKYLTEVEKRYAHNGTGYISTYNEKYKDKHSFMRTSRFYFWIFSILINFAFPVFIFYQAR